MNKLSTAFRQKNNACRIIRSLISKTDGMTLDIPIEVCPVTVRMRRPVRRLEVWWPMLRMDRWVKFLFNQKPQLLLGGQVPDPQGKWKQLYYNFWSVYQKIHGDHPIYSRTDVDLGTCLPYLIHGDEGRGQLKRPYLVVSWQLLIGHNGLEVTNDSGYHGSLIWSTYIFICFMNGAISNPSINGTLQVLDETNLQAQLHESLLVLGD